LDLDGYFFIFKIAGLDCRRKEIAMKKILLLLVVFLCSTVGFCGLLHAETAPQDESSVETSEEAAALPDMTLSGMDQHEEGDGLAELISCHRISVEECPIDRCAVMTNCRGQQICYFKMIDPPVCGNLSYAGQDVPCCPGMVRRCGMAFLDMSCDLHGDNSEYHLPICIPCGDGSVEILKMSAIVRRTAGPGMMRPNMAVGVLMRRSRRRMMLSRWLLLRPLCKPRN
jgi:hypothetical protein